MSVQIDTSKCCGQRRQTIPLSPDRIEDLWPLLKQRGDSRQVKPGLTFTEFQCERCGQLWEYKLECVGHQDWDRDTYKVGEGVGAV
jgi:hypothetical protein